MSVVSPPRRLAPVAGIGWPLSAHLVITAALALAVLILMSIGGV